MVVSSYSSWGCWEILDLNKLNSSKTFQRETELNCFSYSALRSGSCPPADCLSTLPGEPVRVSLKTLQKVLRGVWSHPEWPAASLWRHVACSEHDSALKSRSDGVEAHSGTSCLRRVPDTRPICSRHKCCGSAHTCQPAFSVSKEESTKAALIRQVPMVAPWKDLKALCAANGDPWGGGGQRVTCPSPKHWGGGQGWQLGR